MSDKARIDHIAIAVESFEAVYQGFYKYLPGISYQGSETIEQQGVIVHFLDVGNTHIELLEPIDEGSQLTKFLKKKGAGLHHIALEVNDINKTLGELREAGIRIIDPAPSVGYGGNLIAFVHPGSTSGVLVEMIEKIKEE